MGFRTSRKASLFLSMNLLCYVLAATATDIATACNSCRGPSAPVTPSRGGNSGRGGGSGGSNGPSAPRLPPSGGNSGGGGGSGGGNGPPGTNPGQQPGTCPRDALKLGVCANLLGGLVGVVVGNPPTLPCCTLLAGLVDLEAAVCLCTAIRANVLGINLNVQVVLSLLLNVCGRTPPRGFICPN